MAKSQKENKMTIGNPYHASHGRWVGGTLRKCPKCGKNYNSHPALSREDNKTEICPVCGQREALEAFQNYLKTKQDGESQNDK